MFTISTGTRRVLPNRIVAALVSWDTSTCSMPSEPEKKHTMPIAMPCQQDSNLAKENRGTELATSKKDHWWDYNVWLAIMSETIFGDYKQIHIRLHERRLCEALSCIISCVEFEDGRSSWRWWVVEERPPPEMWAMPLLINPWEWPRCLVFCVGKKLGFSLVFAL